MFLLFVVFFDDWAELFWVVFLEAARYRPRVHVLEMFWSHCQVFLQLELRSFVVVFLWLGFEVVPVGEPHEIDVFLEVVFGSVRAVLLEVGNDSRLLLLIVSAEDVLLEEGHVFLDEPELDRVSEQTRVEVLLHFGLGGHIALVDDDLQQTAEAENLR